MRILYFFIISFLVSSCSATHEHKYYGGYTSLDCYADILVYLPNYQKPRGAPLEAIKTRIIGKIERHGKTLYRAQSVMIRGMLKESEVYNLVCPSKSNAS
ncbi:Uncharacterised protein [Photobacterium damselae]|uniref:Lipoprotein n=1 Tax=Photobacterium damselae TaxID=38293 RepID=A0A2X1ZHY6_PHODM|nr:Uncharacterised protein [Photobacterium damselae]